MVENCKSSQITQHREIALLVELRTHLNISVHFFVSGYSCLKKMIGHSS